MIWTWFIVQWVGESLLIGAITFTLGLILLFYLLSSDD